MSENIGQQVVVDNRTGAGGIIAAEALAKSPPDGYTIFACTTGNFAIIPYLYKSVPYNADKDLIPVTQTGSLPYIIVVHPSLPVKNVKEFIAFAKSHPGQINYASSGVGTASHLSPRTVRVDRRASTSCTCRTRAPGNAMGDLLAGQVVLMFDQPVSSMPHGQGRQVEGAGASPAASVFRRCRKFRRSPSRALPGFEAVSWAGVCVPGGTPKDIINRLQGEIAKVLKLPDISERLMRDGIEPIGGTPEQFQAFIEREKIKWSKVVRDSGARVD